MNSELVQPSPAALIAHIAPLVHLYAELLQHAFVLRVQEADRQQGRLAGDVALGAFHFLESEAAGFGTLGPLDVHQFDGLEAA